jgi:hypothetical protein
MCNAPAGSGPKLTPFPKFKKRSYWIDKYWSEERGCGGFSMREKRETVAHQPAGVGGIFDLTQSLSARVKKN